MFINLALRCASILVLGLIVYAQTFRYDFVFDDHLFIVTNPYIQDFTSLATIFKSFPVTRLIGLYSFALNFKLGKFDPFGYHVFNFIIHIIATLFVWMAAKTMIGLSRRISDHKNANTPNDESFREMPYMIALLFLVHPCQTQAVTYITQRYESMAAMFYIASVCFYLLARTCSTRERQVVLFTASALSAFLGIMTKETALTIPLIILAAEWILISPLKSSSGDLRVNQNRIGTFKNLLPYVFMLCAGIAFCFLFMFLVHNDLSVFALTIASASHDGDVFNFGTYFLTQARVFMTFLRLLIFPTNQNLDYDFPMSTGIFSPPSTALGFVVIGFVVFLIIRFRRQLPLLSFGLAWMLVTFSVNIVPRQNAIFEHKIYLISFGFILAMVALLKVVFKDRKKFLGLLACLVVVLMVMSFNRNQVWKNELTLWEDIYKKSPNKSRVNANLGRVYGSLKRYDQAMNHLNMAIKLKKDDAISLYNRAVLYRELGRDDLALEDINQAIKADEYYFPLFNARALIYFDYQKDDLALADLAQAISIRSGQPEAYMIRAAYWMRVGRTKDALGDLNRVLKLSPHEYGALINRGAIYFQDGQFELALEDFSRAHQLSASSLTYKNLALSLQALGRLTEALKYIEEAIKFDPADQEARQIYGNIRSSLNK